LDKKILTKQSCCGKSIC